MIFESLFERVHGDPMGFLDWDIPKIDREIQTLNGLHGKGSETGRTADPILSTSLQKIQSPAR